MNLMDYLHAVNDEHTFLAFVHALTKDRHAAVNKSAADNSDDVENGWSNETIEGFLESAHAWAEESDFGARQGLDSASPWKKFATFLYCGKVYE
ncbi:hypothetical protein GJV26_16085 [Massilia dura]|uniref:DUF7660 domain-containing protein n=1 Tax=Pseudoduganella dura TaxID=321982 RepID=A0A6I3XK00_9BURK|nr:hypothetical protein [Pseudoduganella dura]MUI13961.1 hypothetical protein [Pseudoduganella dura]GGX98802.1 hypothetical protein GCM10007386_32090 [Pseudoduganella dura]